VNQQQAKVQTQLLKPFVGFSTRVVRFQPAVLSVDATHAGAVQQSGCAFLQLQHFSFLAGSLYLDLLSFCVRVNHEDRPRSA
jgi:hypothetical protein